MKYPNETEHMCNPNILEKQCLLSDDIQCQSHDVSKEEKLRVQPWPIPLSDEIMEDYIPLLASTDQEIKSTLDSSNDLIIRVITWNQQARIPPTADEIEKHLTQRGKYHIIVFGAEECEKSIVRSALNPSKKKWENVLELAVGSDYTMVRSHALQATHIIIYAHRAILHLISNIKSAAIPTGIANTLGNKGGIGISFSVGLSSFCFVNAHLAAHQNNTKRRIYEFAKISHDLAFHLSDNTGSDVFQKKPKQMHDFSFLQSKSKIGSCSADVVQNPLIAIFDYVFWIGDMNFRVNGTREIIDGLLKYNMHEALIHNDQLSMFMKFNPVFAQFSEGPLNFRPTYKFKRGTDEYDPSKKQRIPSWTDRILFKTESDTKLLAYSSATEVRTSDHRPVYASFRTKIRPFIDSNPLTMYIWQQQPESHSQVCTIS